MNQEMIDETIHVIRDLELLRRGYVDEGIDTKFLNEALSGLVHVIAESLGIEDEI